MNAGATQPPVFIVGCGRSGTTLLYELLASHEDFAWFSTYTNRYLRPELAILSRLHWPVAGSKHRMGLQRAIPAPVEGYRIWDACTADDIDDLDAPLSAVDVTPAIRSRVEQAITAHLRYQGGSAFLNKNTRNARRVGFLRELYPDARFVHVLRHPASVARSLNRVDFWRDLRLWWADGVLAPDRVTTDRSEAVVALEFWVHELELLDDACAALPADQLRVIRYEDLTTAPRDIVRSTVEFLDLGWSKRLDRAMSDVRAQDSMPRLPAELPDDLRQRIEVVMTRHGYSGGTNGGPI